MKRKLLSYLLTAVTVLFFWQAGFARTNQLAKGGIETLTKASSLAEGNPTLNLTAPKDGDTVYVGDTLTFKWTSSDIDSVLIGGYIGGSNGPEGGYFMLTGDPDHFDSSTFKPVAASKGMWKMYLDPKGLAGSIKLDSIIIWDAADMHVKDFASPVYVLDTFPMRITSAMPAFGMTDFMPNGWFWADFSCDSIVKGSGNLYLKKDDGTTIMTVSADKIEIHGSSINFHPQEPLSPGAYYVQIDSGFVKCADGSKTYKGLPAKKWNFTVAKSSLIFSEYLEGSSNNKALEVYNPTGQDINLDDYIIAGSVNGQGMDGDESYYYHFPKGTVLKAGDVFVMANSQASDDILKVANDTVAYEKGKFFVCGFNGDDARVLIKVVNNNGHGGDWMWIDAIGNPWEDPGSGWDVAGVSSATKDHTLLRKYSVKLGNAGDWGKSAGSNAKDSEWIVKEKNYSGNLGKPSPSGISITFNVNMAYDSAFNPQKDSVFIAGSFPDATWNEPGTNPKLRMADPDSNNIYTITLSVPDTMKLEYKYFVNAGWGGGEWQGGDNRKAHILGDTTLNDIFGFINNQPPVVTVGVPYLEDFETAADKQPINLKGWTNANVVKGGVVVWQGRTYNDNKYAQVSSYSSGSASYDEVWLITPAIDMDKSTNEKLSFDVNVGYWKHEGLRVMISTDYDQIPADISKAKWDDVTASFTIPKEPTKGYGSFASAGTLDVSGYSGKMSVAFVYNGDAASGETTTYQIDNVKVEGTTGIRNEALSEKVEMYPNPGNGQFHIALNGTLKGAVSLRITDITGRVVMEQKFDHVAPTINVDISSQPSNMYFVTLSDGHNTIVKKFMKR